MREHLHHIKSNVTISLPINVITELDNIANKGQSRNKIINEAILNHLKKRYKINFFQD